jgi:hypothetical protein
VDAAAAVIVVVSCMVRSPKKRGRTTPRAVRPQGVLD